jgi:heme/copper-type cytochrome/quinol oxidase subunit 3
MMNTEEKLMKYAKWSFILFVVFLAAYMFAQSALLSFMIQNQIFDFDKLFGCEGPSCPSEFRRPYISDPYGETMYQFHNTFSSVALLISGVFLLMTIILVTSSLSLEWKKRGEVK